MGDRGCLSGEDGLVWRLEGLMWWNGGWGNGGMGFRRLVDAVVGTVR